jgi:hypothetical protein
MRAITFIDADLGLDPQKAGARLCDLAMVTA